MSAVFNNGQKDGLSAGSGDLRALRKRLWLRSSVLVCSILVFALAAAWVASAFSARDANNVALQNAMTDSLNRGSLMEAYESAKPDVPQAFAGWSNHRKRKRAIGSRRQRRRTPITRSLGPCRVRSPSQCSKEAPWRSWCPLIM